MWRGQHSSRDKTRHYAAPASRSVRRHRSVTSWRRLGVACMIQSVDFCSTIRGFLERSVSYSAETWAAESPWEKTPFFVRFVCVSCLLSVNLYNACGDSHFVFYECKSSVSSWFHARSPISIVKTAQITNSFSRTLTPMSHVNSAQAS